MSDDDTEPLVDLLRRTGAPDWLIDRVGEAEIRLHQEFLASQPPISDQAADLMRRTIEARVEAVTAEIQARRNARLGVRSR